VAKRKTTKTQAPTARPNKAPKAGAAPAETVPAPTPAAEPAKPRAKRKAQAEPKARKLSAVDAAVKVLGETGQAMTCKELIEAMAAKGYWASPAGKTPAGTLYAAILRETTTKGQEARFRKTERGKFALNGVA
jgi:hypothetical protein